MCSGLSSDLDGTESTTKPDDNPEHIHLFDEAGLSAQLRAAGAARVSARYVLNHLLLVAILAPSAWEHQHE